MRSTNPPRRRPQTILLRGSLLALATALAPLAPAQFAPNADLPSDEPSPPASGEAAEAPAPALDIPKEHRHPRAVLEAFITRMREDKKKEAAELLDLSKLSSIAAESRGTDLAYKLYKVIPALGQPPRLGLEPAEALRHDGAGDHDFDYSAAPDDPNLADPWPLSDWLHFSNDLASQITIARDAQNHWYFSAESVAQIDAIYEQAEALIERAAQKNERNRPAQQQAAATDSGEPTETFSLSIRRMFPPVLRKTYFAMPTYQWLLLLLWLPIGRLIDLAVRRVCTWSADWLIGYVDPDFLEARETTKRVWRPVGRLAMASSLVAVAYAIDLPVDIINILLTVLVFVAIAAAVFAAFRVLDLLANYFTKRAKRSQKKFDDLIVPLATTAAKIAAVLLALAAAVATQDEKLPATILGGLGIGGIAIALASQDTLSNFIGSIMLIFDRPFGVGDWVRIGEIEGEVESLGFRSTKLRTGLNSQVSLPNSQLAASPVDNWGRRKYRRYLNKLGVEYGTPMDRVEAFCEGIRELIRRHPHTRKDFYAAYFNDFGPSSLDVLVVAYFEVPDWATELRERHRLLADIARLAESLNVAFAFPTQTVHLQQQAPPKAPQDLTEDDPTLTGAQAAAEIAGELPNYQDRPGKVKFRGPTQLP